ncbi:glucosamine-6-phosphate deaminase [Tropicimonas sp. IMCC34043]|uniref:glucosamine-6-phosphate deaminase n=1 Tax=Tropicimonas sp. IMCC34043 TaxID=2248760 RepID=UPI000E2639C5|nr:glucosamine-6-phosphate deaminase [Tropicimonas sp. IMCC34043]
MRILIFPDRARAVQAAVIRVVRQVQDKPEATLGLATGGTMEDVYRGLIDLHRQGAVSFARASSFNLDEYIGIPASHPQSYGFYMRERLFSQVDFAAGATRLPDGASADPAAAAEAYEAEIARLGPIDLQLLGLGQNGHIGFNEPSSSLSSRTRVKTLTASTVEANSRFFAPGEAQPMRAITMGIATILDARRLLLLATGEAKAEATAQLIEGAVSAMWPCTALQMHRDVTVILDEAAAGLLKMRDYYGWVAEQEGAMHIGLAAG